MISSVQHLLPQAGVTADTTPAHKGKERSETIGKWDMQSTWMVSAGSEGEGKNHSPPLNKPQYILLPPTFSHHSRRHPCSKRTLAIAQDHRAHDPRGMSRAQTHLQLIPRTRWEQLLTVLELTAQGSQGLALPSPPIPKAPFLLLPACAAPVLRWFGCQGCWHCPAIPLPSPGMVEHEELPCSNTRL